jgi:hypothetical protein
VKNALAANASTFENPASSRKIVLMPQMTDAAISRASERSMGCGPDGAAEKVAVVSKAFPGPGMACG